jgi:hypothetical protein
VILLFVACARFDGSFELTDASNYTFSSSIDIGTTDVLVGQDFAIDWSALDRDLLGDPVDPAVNVTDLTLISFPGLSEEDVEAAVVEDALLQSDAGLVALLDTDGATSARLSDFTIGFTTRLVPEEHFTDTEAAWLLRATTGLLDTRMVRFLRPRADGGAAEVVLDGGSSALDFEVELEALEAFEVPADADASAWTADWTALTTRGDGARFALEDVDLLQLARLDMEVTDVEADFVHLETNAAELYAVDVGADGVVTLGEAADAAGTAFSSFGRGETWALALRCGGCTNPAPPYVTLIRSRP